MSSCPRFPVRLFLLFVLPFLLHACEFPEKPVSKEEGAKLAESIEFSMAHQNPAVLDHIFDEQAFAKRAASGSSLWDRGVKDGIIEGIRKARFGQQVLQAMGAHGTYQLVRQYEKEGRQHILFRLYEDGNVNYHDFELLKGEEGAKGDEEVKAADIYIYTSGENLSKTMSDAIMMMKADMPDLSKADLEKINKIKTVKSLLAKRDFVKAGEYYDQFPPDFKKQKMFQLIHIQICQGLGNDAYAGALNQYRALFPNDPNMYLMAIDANVMQKDYPKALEAVNKLDSCLHKDPFQDYYRGLMYKLMKDTVNALACFERLHTSMPAFGEGAVELAAAYTRAGKMDRAVQVIKQAKADQSLSRESQETLFVLYPDLRKAMKEQSP